MAKNKRRAQMSNQECFTTVAIGSDAIYRWNNWIETLEVMQLVCQMLGNIFLLAIDFLDFSFYFFFFFSFAVVIHLECEIHNCDLFQWAHNEHSRRSLLVFFRCSWFTQAISVRWRWSIGRRRKKKTRHEPIRRAKSNANKWFIMVLLLGERRMCYIQRFLSISTWCYVIFIS